MATNIVATNAGVVIIAIDEEGPAAKAGITRGDILLQAGDVAIDSAVTLFGVVTAAKPGDEVTLVVQHGDESRTIAVTLGQVDDRAYLGVQVVDPPKVATVEEVEAPMLEAVPGVAAPVVTTTETVSAEVVIFSPGLFVAEVLPDGPAAQAGLAAGDLIMAIDGQPVASPEDLVNALQGHTPGEVVMLTVQKGGLVGAVIAEVAVTLGAAADDTARAVLGISIVPLPPMPAITAVPAIRPYTSPAMPEMTPGTSYPGVDAGAYSGSACGTPTIQQFFYPPVNGAPFTAPTFSVPPSPMVPAQPALPAAPFFIYEYGVNSEIYPHAASGQTVSVQAMPGQMVPGQTEKNVMVLPRRACRAWGSGAAC